MKTYLILSILLFITYIVLISLTVSLSTCANTKIQDENNELFIDEQLKNFTYSSQGIGIISSLIFLFLCIYLYKTDPDEISFKIKIFLTFLGICFLISFFLSILTYTTNTNIYYYSCSSYNLSSTLLSIISFVIILSLLNNNLLFNLFLISFFLIIFYLLLVYIFQSSNIYICNPTQGTEAKWDINQSKCICEDTTKTFDKEKGCVSISP